MTVQAQILDLLRELQRELGMAVLFVTHDLGVIADLCDRVAVMYAGQIVEQASVHDLFERPQHPYTEGLLGAMPQVADARRAAHVDSRAGAAPARRCPTGCRFAPRCAVRGRRRAASRVAARSHHGAEPRGPLRPRRRARRCVGATE